MMYICYIYNIYDENRAITSIIYLKSKEPIQQFEPIDGSQLSEAL